MVFVGKREDVKEREKSSGKRTGGLKFGSTEYDEKILESEMQGINVKMRNFNCKLFHPLKFKALFEKKTSKA